MTFEVGDKVILTGESDGSAYQNNAKLNRQVGTVTRGPDWGAGMVLVDFDGKGSHPVYPKRLSLAPADLVSYPIAFKPLLDAAIAAASAKRELEAHEKDYADYLESRRAHEAARQKAYKANSRASDTFAKELARAAKL